MLHYILFLTLLGGLFFLYIKVMRFFNNEPGYDKFAHQKWLVVPISIIATVAITAPIVYEFSGWPVSTPITFSAEGHIIKHPYGMFTVGLDGRFSNLPTGHFYRNIENAPTVTLLTENPKVRKMRHSITVELVDYEIFFQQNDRQKGIHFEDPSFYHEVNPIVQSMVSELYDFNNAYSKDMAKFFNPVNEGQQREYEKLVKSALDPVLAKNGFAVAWARFSIE